MDKPRDRCHARVVRIPVQSCSGCFMHHFADAPFWADRRDKGTEAFVMACEGRSVADIAAALRIDYKWAEKLITRHVLLAASVIPKGWRVSCVATELRQADPHAAERP